MASLKSSHLGSFFDIEKHPKRVTAEREEDAYTESFELTLRIQNQRSTVLYLLYYGILKSYFVLVTNLAISCHIVKNTPVTDHESPLGLSSTV